MMRYHQRIITFFPLSVLISLLSTSFFCHDFLRDTFIFDKRPSTTSALDPVDLFYLICLIKKIFLWLFGSDPLPRKTKTKIHLQFLFDWSRTGYESSPIFLKNTEPLPHQLPDCLVFLGLEFRFAVWPKKPSSLFICMKPWRPMQLPLHVKRTSRDSFAHVTEPLWQLQAPQRVKKVKAIDWLKMQKRHWEKNKIQAYQWLTGLLVLKNRHIYTHLNNLVPYQVNTNQCSQIQDSYWFQSLVCCFNTFTNMNSTRPKLNVPNVPLKTSVSKYRATVFYGNRMFKRPHYLTSASPSVVPPDYILIVLILLGQIIEKHTLCNRLKGKKQRHIQFGKYFLNSDMQIWRKHGVLPFSREKRRSGQNSSGVEWT